MAKAEAKKDNKQNFYTGLSIVAAILLIIATSAFWFNKYVFDSKNFTQLTTESITSQSSREAIATEVTDRMLKNRPVLKDVIDEQSIKVISSLLDSDNAHSIIERTTQRLHTAMISKNPEPIELDLTRLKKALSVASALSSRFISEDQEKLVDVGSIPDSIVLVDVKELPNIYQLGTTLNWLGPLSLILALLALVIPIYQTWQAKQVLAKILLIDGVVLLIGGGLGFLLGPVFKPSILSEISSGNMKIVAENLYNSFLHQFNQELFLILALAIIFLIASALVRNLPRNSQTV